MSGQRRTLFKATKLCRFHAEGKCKLGEACTFAHSTEQIQDKPDLSKTRLCAAFKRSGSCTQGEACKFAHGSDDQRLWLGGKDLSKGEPLPVGITSEVHIRVQTP
eukprot:TRINITY_DN4674_c0_g1_i3.p2 TRINITY_DN4674_c0_g1~~TRINITY_DN4674_c0_g1_i3.p2  ORF type:complete len:105 (+),score=15.21 TRINITY_DN4674_c0_g1_i3:93-407(+)